MRRAIFPGTFDPFTTGHADIVKRALAFVDELVIGIGVNEGKHALLPVERREELIRELYKNEPRIEVRAYNGLTTDFAREVGAGLIVRGTRTVQDFEYERTLADINSVLGIETILLFTEPALSYVSSSAVRELIKHGKDVSAFLPEGMKIK